MSCFLSPVTATSQALSLDKAPVSHVASILFITFVYRFRYRLSLSYVFFIVKEAYIQYTMNSIQERHKITDEPGVVTLNKNVVIGTDI